ncbi:hypothetical protein Tco_1182539 [Tanacetum coccineum]
MTYPYHWFSEQVGLAGDLGSTNDVLIPLVEMGDANHTIEEYIELKAKKAHRRGQMFHWETATYEKARYHENIGYFKDFKTNFPAIVFDDALATDHKISSEPTVSLLDDNEIDFRISFDESDNEDYTFIYDKNLFSCKLIHVNNLKTDSKNDNDEVNISSNDVVEQSDSGISINIWHHYMPEIRDIHGSDTRVMSTLMLLFTIRDSIGVGIVWYPLRRPCHRLIAFNISGRGQIPEKVITTNLFYVRSMDEGTAVNVPYLLAQYLFRLDCASVREIEYTWVWVASGPERQQVAAAGAAQADQEIPEEDVQADPTPIQAPQARAATPMLTHFSNLTWIFKKRTTFV